MVAPTRGKAGCTYPDGLQHTTRPQLLSHALGVKPGVMLDEGRVM